MKKVKVTVSISGLQGSYAPGQVVEMEDKEARAWEKRGHGIILEKPKAHKSPRRRKK